MVEIKITLASCPGPRVALRLFKAERGRMEGGGGGGRDGVSCACTATGSLMEGSRGDYSRAGRGIIIEGKRQRKFVINIQSGQTPIIPRRRLVVSVGRRPLRLRIVLDLQR